MKYSIIIPYRNREDHLSILLPRLQDIFKNKDYEIIVSEQDDSDNFRIACVENIGFKFCTGDIIILHQVDYYPLDDVSYEVNEQSVIPAYKGIFVDKDNVSLREVIINDLTAFWSAIGAPEVAVIGRGTKIFFIATRSSRS